MPAVVSHMLCITNIKLQTRHALYSTTVHSHLHGIKLKPLNQLRRDEMIVVLLVRKPCKCACTRLP